MGRTIHGVAQEVGGRNNQQDSFRVNARSGLFVVADGMGGTAAGDVASRMIVDDMREWRRLFPRKRLRPNRATHRNDAAVALATAVEKGNRAVWRKAQTDHSLTGMGTTLTAALLRGRYIIYAHVGDSRLYRLRGRVLTQLTEDHTLAWKYRQLGQPQQAVMAELHHPNVIVRAVGRKPDLVVDTGIEEVQPGDKYLLCTDGLGPLTEHHIIRSMLVHAGNPRAAAEEMVHTSIRLSSAQRPDNSTAVVVECR